MNQILFLGGLHLLGVYFGLLFKKQLPAAFFVITGFLWGALIWVVGGVLLQVLTIPYTPFSISALLALLLSGVTVLHLRHKTWRLSRPELVGLVLFTIAFLLILILASQFNYSIASEDSIIYINTGRRLASEGFSQQIMTALALRGVYLFQLQSASVFLGDGYLYAAQPAFGFSFALAYFYLSQRILGNLTADKRLALVFSLLSSLVLFSTYFIVFQAFYIHTNLISAVYLFLAVSAYWLAAVEKKDRWMIVGSIALVGFSLARTEAPIFALIFLVLVLSTGKLSYRVRLRSILPYLLIITSWYLYLLIRMGAGSYILNRERTWLIIISQLGLALLVILSEVKWIQRFVLPYLPQIMLGSLGLLLVLLVYLEPEHYRISVYALVVNVLKTGRWGGTWLVLLSLFVISLAAPRFPREKIFIYGIISFFVTLLLLAYFREPYRVGWGDSANRMYTHILPLVMLYVLMKTGNGLRVFGREEKGKISV